MGCRGMDTNNIPFAEGLTVSHLPCVDASTIRGCETGENGFRGRTARHDCLRPPMLVNSTYRQVTHLQEIGAPPYS